MDFNPASHEKIRLLVEKGVDIPNPATVDIGEEVGPERISGKGTKLYPGCRIYGAKTVISAGCRLGYEGPVTIDNCALGPKVELKGGFFSNAVFLEKANMGSGAQVREGTILEEEANGAHCVGLKQTILLPFVTLGSLINFCEVLMAGGTSRKNHSEVGSSYIHFNYTPGQDKATPSLLGDVPRGVMLNQPPIFLGGQGGMVGPLRLGFGNVVAAGSVLRQDYPKDNQLITGGFPAQIQKDFIPAAYPNLVRILRNNIIYIANLSALEAWYVQVRKAFFEVQEFGSLVYAAALEQLAHAKKERLKRLQAVVAPVSSEKIRGRAEERKASAAAVRCLIDLMAEGFQSSATEKTRDAFLAAFQSAVGSDKSGYIDSIQNLKPDVSSKGTYWLSGIVADWCERIETAVPSINLFIHQ